MHSAMTRTSQFCLLAASLALVTSALVPSNKITSSLNAASLVEAPTVTAPPSIADVKTKTRRRRPSNNGLGIFDMDDWKWCYTSHEEGASSAYQCKDIEGQVPSDLRGTLFRNGPGNFERGNVRYEHVLDGDGFVSAFTFGDDNVVNYRGSFVKTEYYKKEKQQDKILFRNTFGTQPPGGMLANALDVTLKNVANTNAVAFAGRVFALWEAGKPYELDPVTLQTLPDSKGAPLDGLGGPACLRGVSMDQGGMMDTIMNVGRSFTAHPHAVDDDTLAAFSWAQNPMTNDMGLHFSEFDAQWNVKHSTTYNMEDCSLAPHDFCFSQDYYGFFENRMEMDLMAFLTGSKGPAQVLTQQLDKPCKLHITPRRQDSNKKAMVFQVPKFFCIHVSPMVIMEDETTISIFSSGWDLSDPRYFPKGTTDAQFLGAWGGEFPNFEVIPPSQLWRTTVDLSTERVLDHSVVIPGLNFEHPHIDERNPRYIYGPCSNTVGESTAPCGWCQIDTKTNTMAQVWWAETRIFTEELVVVPKQRLDNNVNGQKATEGCWLLGLMHDAELKRTSLAILDSDNMAQGPVCRIHLKHPLAYGLHGSFAPRPN